MKTWFMFSIKQGYLPILLLNLGFIVKLIVDRDAFEDYWLLGGLMLIPIGACVLTTWLMIRHQRDR